MDERKYKTNLKREKTQKTNIQDCEHLAEKQKMKGQRR
jgi:hypothetical protein